MRRGFQQVCGAVGLRCGWGGKPLIERQKNAGVHWLVMVLQIVLMILISVLIIGNKTDPSLFEGNIQFASSVAAGMVNVWQRQACTAGWRFQCTES